MTANDEKPGSNDLPEVIASSGKFRHEAMLTFFEIYIIHEDHEYAGQAAQAAFTEIDRLENDLSRFVENSDIARVNSLKTGQSTTVGLDVFECLSIADKMHKETFGAFDITISALFKCWLNEDKSLREPTPQEIKEAKKRTGMGFMELNGEDLTVKMLADNVSVDLGGIGKGFALDKAMEVLEQWSISTAFVHSGGSTIVASDKPEGTEGWPVTMSLPDKLWNSKPQDPENIQVLKKINLHNTAMSGSNLEHGKHVIDPRKAKPVEGNVAAWATAPNGTMADGLSTAMLVMEDAEAAKYFTAYPKRSGMAIKPTPGDSYEIKRYGMWEK